jgi:hypothetical protein
MRDAGGRAFQGPVVGLVSPVYVQHLDQNARCANGLSHAPCDSLRHAYLSEISALTASLRADRVGSYFCTRGYFYLADEHDRRTTMPNTDDPCSSPSQDAVEAGVRVLGGCPQRLCGVCFACNGYMANGMRATWIAFRARYHGSCTEGHQKAQVLTDVCPAQPRPAPPIP